MVKVIAGKVSLVFKKFCEVVYHLTTYKLAEREGFEPSVRFSVRFLSRELVSATHPPLRIFIYIELLSIYPRCWKILVLKRPRTSFVWLVL